jgi:hypothetical protein
MEFVGLRCGSAFSLATALSLHYLRRVRVDIILLMAFNM